MIKADLPPNEPLDLAALSLETLTTDLGLADLEEPSEPAGIAEPAPPAAESPIPQAEPETAAGQPQPASRISGLLPASLKEKFGQLQSISRRNDQPKKALTVIVSLTLAFLLAVPLTGCLYWAGNHYLASPLSYSPRQLADFPAADKIARELMMAHFYTVGQAITLADPALLDNTLTPGSPRHQDIRQAIGEWQHYFAKHTAFEDPQFRIQVYLVRDIRIQPETNSLEAVADISTFSNYHLLKRLYEKTNDYELWVRLTYQDHTWRLDDYTALEHKPLPEPDNVFSGGKRASNTKTAYALTGEAPVSPFRP
ncbi:MAG: hypothetical protein PHC60_07635 [Heliobacteriaceae bacterium]|nr:hypothetical protein [Heliobacteriaceae bacterium]